MVHRLFIVLAREPKRTRLLPTVLDLRPGILPLSNRNQHHCIALEQLSGRRPRAQIRYRFILRTWSSLTTLRGLVKIKKSVLFGKTELDKEKRVLDRPTKTVIT